MTSAELVKQLRTASVQADMIRMQDFGYLMKSAADEIERLRKEVARNTLHADWSKR